MKKAFRYDVKFYCHAQILKISDKEKRFNNEIIAPNKQSPYCSCFDFYFRTLEKKTPTFLNQGVSQK